MKSFTIVPLTSCLVLSQKHVVNDFIIPNKNEQTAEQHRGRHFQIQFDLDSMSYLIKDLGVGYGVFVRQEQPIYLKDNMLINVGEAYIVVNLLMGNMIAQDSDLALYQHTELQDMGMNQMQSVHVEKGFEEDIDEESCRLKLKIFGGPSAGEIYFYKPE